MSNELAAVPVDQVKPEKVKKRINSKKKGSNFEGSIGKILSDKLAPMKFRRSQSSGAILGGVNERFMDQFSSDAMTLFIGDVVPTNEADVVRSEGWRLKFTIECKFYRDIDNLEHLLDKTRILSWYEKARRDADKLNKQPLLIFKFNHSRTFLALEDKPGHVLPSTIKGSVVLRREGQNDMRIFFMDEALEDLAWWKLQQTTS